MSAGDCKRCGGDGIMNITCARFRCPSCDGTGKRGWVRVLTRIKRWFQRWGYDGWY